MSWTNTTNVRYDTCFKVECEISIPASVPKTIAQILTEDVRRIDVGVLRIPSMGIYGLTILMNFADLSEHLPHPIHGSHEGIDFGHRVVEGKGGAHGAGIYISSIDSPL